MILEHNYLNNEMNKFKNEILKLMRELESKITEQMKNLSIDYKDKMNEYNDKISVFQADIFSMKEYFAENKLKFEKIDEFELSNRKIENIILTHDKRLNQLMNGIDYLESKYEKILLDNLNIPEIGPNCKYKTLADYIRYNIQESNEAKIVREKFKTEIDYCKNKMDNMYKNIKNMIEDIKRYNYNANNKQDNVNNLIDRKFEDIDKKIMEMKARDIQSKNDFEKLEQDNKDCFDKIIEMSDKLEIIEEKRKNSDKNKNEINENNDNNNEYIFNKIDNKKRSKNYKGRNIRKKGKDNFIYEEDIKEKEIKIEESKESKEKETKIEESKENKEKEKKIKENEEKEKFNELNKTINSTITRIFSEKDEEKKKKS